MDRTNFFGQVTMKYIGKTRNNFVKGTRYTITTDNLQEDGVWIRKEGTAEGIVYKSLTEMSKEWLP